MNKLACRVAIVFSVLAVLTPHFAQSQVRVGGRRGRSGGRWYQPRGYVVGGGYRGGGYWGGWNQGPSTVGEGYGRGMAEVIRAQGERSKAEAQARLSRAEARAKHLENKRKSAETYYALKERHRSYKEEKRRLKSERAAAGRARLEASAAPPRYRGLGPDDFDEVTGKIYWPELLQQDTFAKSRRAFEELFEHRTLTGGAAGKENSQQIQKTAKVMRAELKKLIKQFSSADYMAAKKFIDALAFEGRA